MAGSSFLPTVEEAREEGKQAFQDGRSRLSNPYIARCPGNNSRHHKRTVSGWCYLCDESPSDARARERRRAAWDRAFDAELARRRKVAA